MTVTPPPLPNARLKTRHLVLLHHLAERGSIMRAAEAAAMTQPAATKLVAELEDIFGVALFTRHGRGVTPTIYGEVVTRHARHAISQMRAAHDEVAALKSGLAGQVSIGTVITSATDLLPQAVALLKQKYPGVGVRIDLDFSEALVARLIEGKLDMVIARTRNLENLGGLECAPLAEDPHAFFVRNHHPLARRSRLRLADLAEQAWILPPPGNILRDRLAASLFERGISLPGNLVETAALPVIISLLQAGDMVAVLSDHVARPYCKAGILQRLRLPLDLSLGPAGIITRKDHLLSPGAQAMLALLLEAGGRIRGNRTEHPSRATPTIPARA